MSRNWSPRDHVTNTLQNAADKADQSSQIAFFALSASSCLLFSAALSSSLLLLSFSSMAFRYALCSSVILGALRPSAPAIMRRATASVFSGLLAGPAPSPPYGSGGGDTEANPTAGSYVGERGVGGGAEGMLVSSWPLGLLSSSEDEETSSSSHESATFFFFGFAADALVPGASLEGSTDSLDIAEATSVALPDEDMATRACLKNDNQIFLRNCF